ncbi:patatin-like phospholipase family protein [Vibrio agarivorans]|uniref:patatin-like phospholipase family protein n=1 Tax=Vibrio agarivorans TaxID=153622 RepID=UPI0025B3DA13|nr:patatin-like phospholipase family protein [Vibrio agarivorans]MDN3660201.1 patatin-like phospholipase family protein [Vibrio agarivorans]
MVNRLSMLLILIGVLSGCSTINRPLNTPQEEISTKISRVEANQDNNQVTVILAFSGGGTRAAALSYGVLEQLKETNIVINGEQKRLLDEVDVISSVSGGSFTSAYYGLYQDKIFTDYRDDFLYRDVKDDLVSTILSPIHWFSTWGRTGVATKYYQDNIFGDATFGDFDNDGPSIIINASDITTGLRFSFVQPYFDLLCSDISDYPISNAVAASAAVPVLFEPVVLENHDDCASTEMIQTAVSGQRDLSFQSKQTVRDIQEYSDKEKNQYIHLVDGGITDNLGLLAIYDLLELGDYHGSHYFNKQAINHHVIVISVDASTEPELGIGKSAGVPSVSQTLNSITDIQLHRYNDATKSLFMKSLTQWAQEASTGSTTVHPHFVQVAFVHTPDLEKRLLFNQVPTDLTLDHDVVDSLIQEGRDQLRNNRELNAALESIELNDLQAM